MNAILRFVIPLCVACSPLAAGAAGVVTLNGSASLDASTSGNNGGYDGTFLGFAAFDNAGGTRVLTKLTYTVTGSLGVQKSAVPPLPSCVNEIADVAKS